MFAGVERTPEQIAKFGASRRDAIYNFYLTLNQTFVSTLTEVNCCSVAFLYSYLNDGEQWQTNATEYGGYVDGLFEVGSYMSVAIDSSNSGPFDLHTSCHELGHSTNYYLIDSFFYGYLEIARNKSEKPVTEYGQSECSEDFAESFGFFFGKPAHRAHLLKKCPKRYAFMQKLQNAGKRAMLPDLRPTKQLTRRFAAYDEIVWGQKKKAFMKYY